MKHALVLVLVAFTVVLVPAAASGSAPPGATAQCNDGTYSYSQHHSGTCSSHGGVAVWLDGSTATPSAAAAPAATSSSTSAGPSPINLGTTVLLKAKTKVSGCTLGPRPDRQCSPGAYYSGLTRAVICSSTFRTGPIRNVPDSEKHQVEIEYGLAAKGYGSTLEIDHIVSLEVGGSNDPTNLFPEEATFTGHQPGFHVKDKLENALHKAVCAGTIGLRSAQQQIASNWELLYKKLYGVAPTGS
jgi:uncharacterized protein DUF3761